MRTIEVWPAVDLLAGQVARLRQGDYATAHRYHLQPIDAFQRLLDHGVPRLHLVDLSGAASGAFDAWSALARAVRLGLRVEAGGGFRTPEAVARALAEGAQRVVVGTGLVESPVFADTLLERFGADAIVAAVDVQDGRAKVRGWTANGEADAFTLWERLYARGFRRVNVTDIQQDGSLAGIREAFWRAWSRQPGECGAGGGIRSPADLATLAELGIPRAVVGKAWLEEEGWIDLASLSEEES